MSLEDYCKREDHIDTHFIEKCPLCGGMAFHIQETLQVTEYCDKTHLADSFECLFCDAVITLELLLRLLEAEERVKRLTEDIK